MTSTAGPVDGVEAAKERARRAVAEGQRAAGAQALRDAAREARVVELHGAADQWDWANWLERRAMEIEAGVIGIGEVSGD